MFVVFRVDDLNNRTFIGLIPSLHSLLIEIAGELVASPKDFKVTIDGEEVYIVDSRGNYYVMMLCPVGKVEV